MLLPSLESFNFTFCTTHSNLLCRLLQACHERLFDIIFHFITITDDDGDADKMEMPALMKMTYCHCSTTFHQVLWIKTVTVMASTHCQPLFEKLNNYFVTKMKRMTKVNNQLSNLKLINFSKWLKVTVNGDGEMNQRQFTVKLFSKLRWRISVKVITIKYLVAGTERNVIKGNRVP